MSYGIPYLAELWAHAADRPTQDASEIFGDDFRAALCETIWEYRTRRLQEDLDRHYNDSDAWLALRPSPPGRHG